MIAYLRGRLRQVIEEGIILETGGIGWLVRTPAGQEWPQPGAEVAVHTYLVVKENALELYGFSQQKELRLFTLLLGVSGIGPRGALQIMAAASVEELVRAIAAEDAAFLTALPGIGTKKARRLLLELKDTIQKDWLNTETVSSGAAAAGSDYDEALAALLALGYNREEANPYLVRVRAELGPKAGTAAVLQAVLQAMGQGGGK